MSSTHAVSKNLNECQPRDLIKLIAGIERGWALVGKGGLVLVLDEKPRGLDFVLFSERGEFTVLNYGSNYVMAGSSPGGLPVNAGGEPPIVMSDKTATFIKCTVWAYEEGRPPDEPPQVGPSIRESFYHFETGEFGPNHLRHIFRWPSTLVGSLYSILLSLKSTLNSLIRDQNLVTLSLTLLTLAILPGGPDSR
jgi:hypothetical protein